ncbi:DUF2834 domain-containing protein [Stenotrophomonas sp. PS02298]|uniref:DUF2834 domain-containing protein n=1 Tax=Stenotrophomonas sp. PS02298 TaxID=2991424 RepID=UPI00249A0948|nr:DUF2834 domain-containing protein [Stenotrophomonas sp. PS02298]
MITLKLPSSPLNKAQDYLVQAIIHARDSQSNQPESNMRFVYLLLCIAGTALPLAQFVPWISANGLNVPLLVQQATSSNIAAFAWADVLISGLATIALICAEGRRLGMRRLWLPLSGIVVGPSLALPLFLLLRERHLVTARKKILR